METFRPGLLLVLQFLDGSLDPARLDPPGAHAQCRLELRHLPGVEVRGELPGLLGCGGDEGFGRRQAVGEGVEPGGQRQDLVAPFPGLLVQSQGPGATDVSLGSAGTVLGHHLVHTVAADQQFRHFLDWRGDQPQLPAAGTDGDDHVVGAGRAQQPHGFRCGFLQGLQQRVGTAFGDAVRVLDHDHLPAAVHGRDIGPGNQLTHLVDADAELFGAQQGHVGVGAGQRRAAVVAASAAAVVALESSRERTCRIGTPRPGRPDEQPRVGHGVPAARHRTPQRLNGPVLTHEFVPHAHVLILPSPTDEVPISQAGSASA